MYSTYVLKSALNWMSINGWPTNEVAKHYILRGVFNKFPEFAHNFCYTLYFNSIFSGNVLIEVAYIMIKYENNIIINVLATVAMVTCD